MTVFLCKSLCKSFLRKKMTMLVDGSWEWSAQSFTQRLTLQFLIDVMLNGINTSE